MAMIERDGVHASQEAGCHLVQMAWLRNLSQWPQAIDPIQLLTLITSCSSALPCNGPDG